MINCSECGTENPDDARVCAKCRASLTGRGEIRKEKPFRLERAYRVISIVGLAFGILIVLAGLIWLLQQADLIPRTIEIWPFAAIILGLLIIIGAFHGIRRKQ